MLEELEKQIEKEKATYAQRKKLIEKKLISMPISLDSEKDSSDLAKGLKESQHAFEELKMHSKTIERSIAEISNVSKSALKNFETLKYRKQNIEAIISAMTAFSELRRILPLLETCITQKNVEEATKHMKNYKTFSSNLLQGFNKTEVTKQQEIFKLLGEMSKEQFEEALRKNDTIRLHHCTELSEQLGLCENSLERVAGVYVSELQAQLALYNTEWTKSIVGTFRTDKDNKQQGFFPFAEVFIGMLERLAGSFTGFKENIYAFYGIEGVLGTLKRVVNEAVITQLEQLFKRLNGFYETENTIGGTGINSGGTNSTNTNQSTTSGNQSSSINSKGELARLDMFCEEPLIDAEPLLPEHKRDKTNLANNQIQQLRTNELVLTLMDAFLRFQRTITKQQITAIVRDSPAFARLWNFDKLFFFPYLESEEPLFNIQKLHEYLDEIFYVMETGAIRALESLSKPTACAVLNYLSSLAIHEDLYYIQDSLMNKYLKRENFNSQAISFNVRNTVHNSFVIVLFNNIQMLKVYVSKLKQKLLGSVTDLYDKTQCGMLIATVEELESSNEQRFTEFSNMKMKILVDLLKSGIKNSLEDLRLVNFTMNEAQQEEYERGATYASEMKSKFVQYLAQWRNQFTKENYELFMYNFCTMLAELLEKVVTDNKRYHLMGAFLLDKEIRNLTTFFQNATLANVKPCFSRISMVCEILKLENNAELQEFCALGTGEFSREDVKRIIRLRQDFK